MNSSKGEMDVQKKNLGMLKIVQKVHGGMIYTLESAKSELVDSDGDVRINVIFCSF